VKEWASEFEKREKEQHHAIVEVKKELEASQRKVVNYEEETMRQFESNERLTGQIKAMQDKQQEQLIQEKGVLQEQVAELQGTLMDIEKMY